MENPKTTQWNFFELFMSGVKREKGFDLTDWKQRYMQICSRKYTKCQLKVHEFRVEGTQISSWRYTYFESVIARWFLNFNGVETTRLKQKRLKTFYYFIWWLNKLKFSAEKILQNN